MNLREIISILFNAISFSGLFYLFFCLTKELIKMDKHISQSTSDEINFRLSNTILKLFNNLFSEPAMLENEKKLLYKYLDLSNVYNFFRAKISQKVVSCYLNFGLSLYILYYHKVCYSK